MNSASIDEISSLPNIEQIIIPPSPGDAGCSIGAAYYSFIKTNSKKISRLTKPSFFPCCFNSKEQEELAKKIISEGFKILTNEKNEALSLSAQLIKQGEIIGTVLNNAETGPRALGNRSLICDGTNKNSVRILNTIIKNRSPFSAYSAMHEIRIRTKTFPFA